MTTTGRRDREGAVRGRRSGEPNAGSKRDDRRAVGRVVRKLVDTWNRGDSQGFAALFTPSAEYFTGSGRKVCGRDEIAELVKQADPGSVVTVAGFPAIESRKGSATARFDWVAAQGGDGRRGTIRCTLGLHGTRWLIEALRNDEDDGSGDGPTSKP